MTLQTIQALAFTEFRSLHRQRTLTLLLIVFLGMTLFSTYIGWSTKQTISGIYEETVNAMAADGVTQIPANPFLHTPALTMLKNMSVYVVLNGSLLAIIVGYNAFIRERRAGVTKLVFSRAMSRHTLLTGKIAGIFLVLLTVMAAALAISIVSASLVSSRLLSLPEIGRLLAYYGLSLEYMTIFGLLGLFFAIQAKSESLALLSPVAIWLVISFVLPQLTSALDPTALLNPTSILADFPQGHFFLTVRAIIEPFSISEHYKIIGRTLLEGAAGGLPMWPSVLALIIVAAACFAAINRFNVCEEEINE